MARLAGRAAAILAEPEYAPFFSGWTHPWEFSDPETAARRLREAGFEEVETGLEATPTVMPDAAQFSAFVAEVIFPFHLARIPDRDLRARFVARLTEQASGDDPPFLIDYWRLNLRGRRSPRENDEGR